MAWTSQLLAGVCEVLAGVWGVLARNSRQPVKKLGVCADDLSHRAGFGGYLPTNIAKVVTMYITELERDAELIQMMRGFVASTGESSKELGLSPDEVAELETLVTNYGAGIDQVAVLKAQLAQAVSAKDEDKRIAKDKIAFYAKIWRANPEVPNSLLTKLDLPTHEGKVNSKLPIQPSGLEADATVDGRITLKWDRNGNNPRALFIVETAYKPDGPWTISEMTTKTKVVLKGVPGNTLWFRVIAKRNERYSAYSLPISIWPNEGASTVDKQAA